MYLQINASFSSTYYSWYYPLLFNQQHFVEGITSAKMLIVTGLHVFMFFRK